MTTLPRPQHIVHVVLSLDVGGLERLVLQLGRIQRERGHQLTILCVEHQGEMAQQAKELGFDIACLNKPPGRHRSAIRDAERFLDESKPNLIHTHQIGAAWYLGQASAKKFPIVHTEHGNPFARAANGLASLKLRLLYRTTARSLSQVCCVSQEICTAVRAWKTVAAEKVCVVPNGVPVHPTVSSSSVHEIRARYQIPPDAMVVGTVGRLHEVKRQDLLVEAIEKLSAEFPNLHAILVGDGLELQPLQRLVSSVGLDARIHFAGYQSHPEAFYPAFDLFTLTSRSEGFPVSLLEAWVAGRPVVCTKVGAIPNVVTDGVDGLLVPPGDSSAIATAIRRLLENPQLRTRLGEAGRKTVQDRYSVEAMTDEYDRIYANVSHLG